MKRFLDYVLVVICMLCMAGCQNEDVPEEVTEPAKEPGLYLCLNTAGSGNGFSTRAALDNEDYVTSLYALYFKVDSAGDDQCFFVEKETINVNSSQKDFGNAQTFELYPTIATVSVIPSYWRIVFVANMNPSTVANESLTSFKERVQVTSTSVSWEGTAANSLPTTNVPMSYCTGNVVLPSRPYHVNHYVNDKSSENNTTPTTLDLVRMMAKFTITSNKLTNFGTDADLYNYEITKIRVINGYGNGLVCYNNTPTTYWDNAYQRAVLPTIPSTPLTTGLTPIDIVPSAYGATNQTVTFYTFERGVTVTNDEKSQSNFYIQLTGNRINSSDTKETESSNYMIPVYAIQNNNGVYTAIEKTPGPVLRNHYYKYTINGVHKYALRVKLNVADWIPVNITVDPIPLP